MRAYGCPDCEELGHICRPCRAAFYQRRHKPQPPRWIVGVLILMWACGVLAFAL